MKQINTQSCFLFLPISCFCALMCTASLTAILVSTSQQRKPCPELPEEVLSMVLVHLTSYHESENLPEEPPMDWTLMTVRMMSASIRLVNTEWRRAHDAMLEELAPSRLPDLPHPRKGLSRFPNVKIFNLRLCMYDAGIPEGLFEDVAAVWPHLTKLDARRCV